MSVLPIDIQTIMGQLNHVSRSQHNLDNSPLVQQQNAGNVIHHKALEKDNQVNNFNQLENQDKIINPDKEQKNSSSQQQANNSKKQLKKEKEPNQVLFKDPNKGNLIDLKR